MVLDGDLDPIVQSAVDTDDAARLAALGQGSSGP
jgi:peptide chain release factor 1